MTNTIAMTRATIDGASPKAVYECRFPRRLKYLGARRELARFTKIRKQAYKEAVQAHNPQ